jgi:hypothetical protein
VHERGQAFFIFPAPTFTQSDYRLRPEITLKIKTTSAMTKSRWMKEPAIWPIKPSSQRITKTTTTVYSMMDSPLKLGSG